MINWRMSFRTVFIWFILVTNNRSGQSWPAILQTISHQILNTCKWTKIFLHSEVLFECLVNGFERKKSKQQKKHASPTC